MLKDIELERDPRNDINKTYGTCNHIRKIAIGWRNCKKILPKLNF